MTRSSNPRLRVNLDRVAALAVALAPVLYFLPAILNGSVLCPDDGTIFNTPLRVATANIMFGGSLPLWNPYIFSGMPLLASAQGGTLFPPNWFYLVFNAALATNLMVVVSYMIAALGAYLYARRSGASVAGSVVTSLAWQWGGFLVGQIGHINIVQTAACLPWVLWAMDGYALDERHNMRKQGVLLAAFVALQTFAGHQQTLAYSLLLASAYAVASAFAARESRSRYLWSLAFVGAGLLLAAVQILPTFELLRNSLRAESTYDFFTSFSMPPRMIETFLAPYVAGGGDGSLFRAPYVGPPYYGEMAGYVGVVGLMLVLCAVVFRRDARTKFWTAAALACLTLALGRYAPLKFYKLIYYVPILNLFRVPARHLMEAEFALAVLAGRGLTVLQAAREDSRTVRRVMMVAACCALLTCVVVTLGRPADFRLAREASVGFMRAPELFVPVLVACASAWALWSFAKGRRGATVLLITLLALDLALWGQSSGWRQSSPKSDAEYWREPETVKFLRAHGARDPAAYRILTAPHAFDPAVPPVPPSVSHSTEWSLWTQPDVYMMSGVPNAAGYDGFGLARYSRLAGEMKVWGELTDPDATLRGDSREIDLLNVRYLLSMRAKGNAGVVETNAPKTDAAKPDAATNAAPAPPPLKPEQEFPPATQRYGEFMFAESDLGLPNIGAGKNLRFALAPVEADRIALLTNLSWSEDVPEGTPVGHVRLHAADGRVFDFVLRAGADTAEWAYDRADIRARIRHKRPTVATSYAVADAKGDYEGHTYVTSFALPERVAVGGVEIVAESSSRWPDLLLGVFRVSLVDAGAGRAYALRREWVSVEKSAGAGDAAERTVTKAQSESSRVETDEGAGGKTDEAGARWRLLGQTAQADIYENARALPRVWLASGARALSEQATLEVIRTGRLPGGESWEPLHTALVESEPTTLTTPATASAGSAEVMRYEPNRVDVRATCDSPSILVLSENHYPGWRAYLDGESVGVLRVDYNLRGVFVPAGRHEVRFIYRPKSVLAGVLVSLLSLAGLLLWWSRRLPEASLLRLASRLRGREIKGAE